jgi:hypothetical protein
MSDGISDVGLHIRCSGKFEVELLPSSWIARERGVILPAGFDYGFTEAITDETGPEASSGWGVVWRVLNPGGWIRSVTDSVRSAASQVPASSANIIYLHVPTGSLGVVTTRIDCVAPEVEHLLSNPDRHTRVNAVVLTGQATLHGWSSPNDGSVRYVYRAIENAYARNPLPRSFRVFGRDFTRKAAG